MQYRNIDKQALKENGYTVLAKISIVGTDTVFTEDDYIVDWDYEDYRYVPNNGFIGQFVERILDGNLQNISDGVILEDTEINLKLGIKNALDNDTITWYDYGNFLITKVEKTDTTGNYRFESADYTKKFNIPFKDYIEVEGQIIPIAFPTLAMELMDFTCFQAGVIPDYPEADNCSYYIVPEEGLSPGNYYFEVYEDTIKYINFTTTSYLGKNSVLLFIPGENKLIQKFVGYSPDHELVINRTELTFTKQTTHTGSWLEQRNSAYIDFTNNDFVIESNQYDSEDTCRKVMQDIAKLAYSWVRIGEDNKVHIDFTPKSTSSVDQYDQLTTDEYYVSKKSDLTFGPVNKVLIGMSDVEGENLYVTSQDYTEETECAIKIYDNNLTNTEELRAIALYGAEKLFGVEYTPIEINSVGHPWLDGDELIKLTNVDNEVIYTYPFNRKIHYAGYIEGVIGAEASTTQNTKYEYKNDIISNVKRTAIIVDKQEQTITALAENVDENSSNISQMQIDLNGINLRVQSVETTEVTGVTNEYAVNDDASNPPAQSSSDWSTTKPTRGEGEYIWARIKTTYKSGNVSYSNPVNTTGDKGDTGGAGPQGPAGEAGDDGKGIVSVTELYYVSNSSATPAKPTAHVTVSSLAGYNQWNLQCPPYVNTGQPQTTYTNFFTCSEILYTDETYGWTNVTQNQGLAIANQNAYDATNTATSASTTANNAFNKINNLQIGGRNYIQNSGNFVDLSPWIKNGGVTLEVATEDTYNCLHALGSIRQDQTKIVYNLKWNTTYTYHAFVKFSVAGTASTSSPLHYWFYKTNSPTGMGASNALPSSITTYVDTPGNTTITANKWHHIVTTFTTIVKPEDYEYLNFLPFFYGTAIIKNDTGYDYYVKWIKLEEGNTATDWTPAPEDVDQSINNAITEIGNQLSNYVTTTTYDADWQNRKDEIYSYVNVNYTTTSDFGTYQETMQTALSQKADATTISATATQIVNDAISGIQDTVSNIEETFTFDTNGLTIARGGNTMYLQLQNDKLAFRTDGTDAGERAYMTSTEFVLKQLQSFQIGNFKFEVRTNGSLDFKKV